MCEKQIDCMTVGRVKPRKRNYKRAVGLYVTHAVESLGTVLTLIGAGCFVGIGFGVGLAYAMAIIG